MVYASIIEPEPIAYKQEVVYNEEVSHVLTTSFTDTLESEATLPLPSDEVVFVPEPVVTDPLCYCVTFLREVLGISIRGDAKDIPVTTDVPIAGGVVLFKYPDNVYHAAKIKYIMLDRMLIQEANYLKCKETERVVFFDDPFIRGYYFRNPN